MHNELRYEISQNKSWPKTVKFDTTLAATLFNISIENYTNVCSKSKDTGILITHTDVTQWRVQSECIVSRLKTTVMLHSFKHNKLWHCTAIFTVSFTVNVHCVPLLDDTLSLATPFIDIAVSEPLREFVTLHMLELLDWVVVAGGKWHPNQRKAVRTSTIQLQYNCNTRIFF